MSDLERVQAERIAELEARVALCEEELAYVVALDGTTLCVTDRTRALANGEPWP